MKINNPCIGVCKFDDATGLCKACFRTRDERKTWKGESEAFRAGIIALRPEREQSLIAAGTALPSSKSAKSTKSKKDGKEDAKKTLKEARKEGRKKASKKKDRKGKKNKKKAEKKKNKKAKD